MIMKEKTRSITAERAQKILAENDLIVDTSQALQILDFLYTLAMIEFDNLKNK
jgi:hypothetical protein